MKVDGSTVSPNGRRFRPKCASYNTASSNEGLGQSQQRDSAGVEDLAGAEQGTLAGQRAVVDEDRGVDRAVQDRRAEAGEEGTAVEQDQVEISAEPRQDDRPAGAGEKSRGRPTGARRGSKRWSSGASRSRRPARDPARSRRQARPGTRTELPGEHRAGEIRVHQQAPSGPPRQRQGEGEDQGRPSSARWQLVNSRTLRCWRSRTASKAWARRSNRSPYCRSRALGIVAGHLSRVEDDSSSGGGAPTTELLTSTSTSTS